MCAHERARGQRSPEEFPAEKMEGPRPEPVLLKAKYVKALKKLCAEDKLSVHGRAKFHQILEACKIIARLIEVECLQANKINSRFVAALKATFDSLKVDLLTAARAVVENFRAEFADVNELRAIRAVLIELRAEVATVGKLVAKNIETEVLCFRSRPGPPQPEAGLNCLFVVDGLLQFINEEGIIFTVNTTPVNPFEGFWLFVNKLGGNTLNQVDGTLNATALRIDTRQIPFLVFRIAGPADALREPIPRSNPIQPEGEEPIPFLPTEDPNLIISLVGFPVGIIGMQLQPDRRSLVIWDEIEGTASPGLLPWGLLQKIAPPPVRPYDIGALAFPDANDPVFMFNEFCKYLITQEPTTTEDLDYDYNPGYAAIKQRQQDLLTTGVSYSTEVLRVQASLNPPLLALVGSSTILTTVETKESPHFLPASGRVTFSGFAPPYDALFNDKEFVTQFEQNVIYAEPDDPREAGFLNAAHNNFSATIRLDTSALPKDQFGFLPNIGTPTVTTRVGPITSGSGYRELIAAMFEMFIFVMTYSTHSRLSFFTPRPAVGNEQQAPETFEDLKALLQNLPILRPFHRIRNPYPKGSMVYDDTGIIAGRFPRPTSPYIDSNFVPVNNPFRFLPFPGNLWDYNVAFNFLVPGSVRNVYWTLDGPATEPVQQLAGQLYLGDPTIGQTFISQLQPFGSEPADGRIWYLLGGVQPGFNPYVAQIFFAGVFNPALTDGVRVGYLRLANTSAVDPFVFMSDRRFTPPGRPETPRTNYEAYMQVVAPLFQYLRQVSDVVLINSAANQGGTLVMTAAIPQFFGADRQALDPALFPIADYGFAPLFDALDFQTAGDAYRRAQVDPYRRLLPSISEQFYPGSVFTGRVVFMNSLQSASGGDLFPHFFLGDSLNKDLGNGTTVRIFGEISGRLLGATEGFFNPTITKVGYRLTLPNGQPVPPYQMRVENAAFGVLKLAAEPTTLVNPVPELKPDSDASGIFPPGPWNDDFENTVYPDYGLVPPIYPPLPGDGRPAPNTDPSNQALWRYIWLEVALRNAILP